MPNVLNIGRYHIYFWSNEGVPLEPIHVHISDGTPTANATKVWITKAGKCLICNNNSNIKEHILKNMIDIIESQNVQIVNKWMEYFKVISYYC